MNTEIRDLDDTELETVSGGDSIAVATYWIMETVRIAHAEAVRIQGSEWCAGHSHHN
jgi:hypothetical protein